MPEIVCPYGGPQQVREFLRADHISGPSIPEALPPAGSPEAYHVETRIKPATTAIFSQLIGQVVDIATAELPDARHHYLAFSPIRNLHLDLRRHYNQAIADVTSDASNAETIADLSELLIARKKLHPIITKDPVQSLKDGANTAINTSLTIMRDMQDKHDSTLSAETLVRSMTKPIVETAKMNECQLEIVERSVLPKDRLPELAAKGETVRYAHSLLETAMTSNDRKALLALFYPQREAATIGDVTSQSERLGCPIVYTPKNLVRVIDHIIRSAADRDLI